ncbi:MAG: hypothetical protein V7L29_17770 [Nostoc sp.]|uniref:hypothetical protein n=1 Tax=Nostoc sp. TaxID=1180 RepID=UPI002FF62D5D
MDYPNLYQTIYQRVVAACWKTHLMVHCIFFNRPLLQNPELQLIPWLVEHQRFMGLLKAVRQRHSHNAAGS